MEVFEQTSTLTAVRTALLKSPDSPWYLVALVQVALDLAQEVNALHVLCKTQEQVLQEQYKSLETLNKKYSEVLYCLKTIKE